MHSDNNILFIFGNPTTFFVGSQIILPSQPATLPIPHQSCKVQNIYSVIFPHMHWHLLSWERDKGVHIWASFITCSFRNSIPFPFSMSLYIFFQKQVLFRFPQAFLHPRLGHKSSSLLHYKHKVPLFSDSLSHTHWKISMGGEGERMWIIM